MPVFVPSSDTFLLEFIFSLFSQVVEITSHWTTSTPLDETYLEDIAGQAYFDFGDTVLDSLGDVLHLVRVVATSLESAIAPKGIYVPASPQSGAVSGGSYPANAPLVITKRTSSRGRSYRGRAYIPGIPLSASQSGDTNQVTNAFITGLLEDYADFLDLFTVEAGTPVEVVCSKYSAGAPRVTAVKTPIMSYAANNQIDSQRRRLTGRGS